MKMRKISKILTTGVKSVATTDTLSDAVAMMKEERISCVLVLDGRVPRGILTERDIVRAVSRRVDFSITVIGDVMISPVVKADKSADDLSIFDIYELLATNEIRHLAVVDNDGDIAGVVTQTDVIRCLDPEYFVAFKEVGTIMTHDIVTLPEDGTLGEAVALMAEEAISCVIIISGIVPVGIITERDITRLAAEGEDLFAGLVGQYMSAPVETVTIGTTLQNAVSVMTEKKLRRLVIIGQDGLLAGIITQFDIIKGLESEYVKVLKEKVNETEGRLRDVIRQLDEKSVYLDNILRSAKDEAIVTCTPDMRINYFNPVAEYFYNISASEALGMRIDEIHKREGVDGGRVDKMMSDIRSTGRASYTIDMGEGADRRVLDVRISTITDRAGKIIGFGHFARDITALEETGEALKRSEAGYRSLVENIDMGITLIDSDYRVVMANKFQGKLFKREPGEFVGNSCFEEFERRDGVCDYCPGTTAMETGRYAEVDTVGTLDSGKKVSIHIKAFPVLDHDGKVSGFIEVVEDITERKKTEAERESMIGALMDAFERIKILHGLIPICSYCAQ